jgi:DNA polymerase
MPVLFVDLETRSVASLHDCGSFIYSIHPSTELHCIAYAVDDEPPELWLPGDPVPPVFAAIAADPPAWKFVAHNYDFERHILENVATPRLGFPLIPHGIQHCTQRLALANGYPAELDLLAQALGLPYRKDPAARKAMLAVSRPRPARKRGSTTPLWDEDPEKLKLLYERCQRDCRTTRAAWQSPKLKHLSEIERGHQLEDIEINERGIRLDRAFATAARDLSIQERIAIGLKLRELTDGVITTADQCKRFLKVINARGHDMTSLDKAAVVRALANKPDDYVCQLLELRQAGARASVNKYKRMLAYASEADDRMRGTLRMYGAGPGRWVGLGPQLQNLKKNENNLPLSVVDQIRAGDHSEIAKFGNPLSLLGDVSRAALCAAEGMELKSADFSAIESVVLAWLANEQWKLKAYKAFFETEDDRLEPYRVIARKMLRKAPDAEISPEERQLGKGGELALGFGGGSGAWRRFVPDDPRSDEEIKATSIQQWRDAHPATRRFWNDLAMACRVAIKTGQPILVAPAPQPPITAAFADGNLTLTLPSGRAITYPEARLVPGKYEEGPSDVEFKDNSKGQWKPDRAWFGTLAENVVQGTARDLLAAAIDRFEMRGIPVVFHCHDEVTVEILIGSLSDAEFLAILLELPDWAAGLPLGGKVHSGSHYLEAPKDPAVSKAEALVDALIEDAREDIGEIDPALAERADDEDYVTNLADDIAPLTELVGLPLTLDNKVCCPFHGDTTPSCAIYPDHFYCYGCGERGSRLTWLTGVEGMTEPEAIAFIKDWPPAARKVTQNGGNGVEKLAFVKSIWTAAQPLAGTMAARYLAETRCIDLTKLPEDVHRCLRFHPNCAFGPGIYLPCLIALMRDPLSDAPVGIQRTALKEQNGKIEKIDRRMLGASGVVKIWPAGPRLVVAEGLETVLAAATRIPYEDAPLVPAWAALSSQKLGALPAVPGVERLIILADHDPAGRMAADACTARWNGAGRIVTTLTPDQEGADFNDLVLEGGK